MNDFVSYMENDMDYNIHIISLFIFALVNVELKKVLSSHIIGLCPDKRVQHHTQEFMQYFLFLAYSQTKLLVFH